MTTEDDFDTQLDEADLPEQSFPLCLRGKLVGRLQQLEMDLEEAKRASMAGAASLAGDGTQAITEQIEQIRQQMAAGSVQIVMRGLPKPELEALLAKHPPRPEDLRDMRVGYNRETMGVALVRACIVKPEMNDQRWQRLQSKVTAGQWARFDRTASELNFTEVNIPF